MKWVCSNAVIRVQSQQAGRGGELWGLNKDSPEQVIFEPCLKREVEMYQVEGRNFRERECSWDPTPDPGLVSPALEHSSSEFFLVESTRAVTNSELDWDEQEPGGPPKELPKPQYKHNLLVSNLCYINFLSVRKQSPK